jgi:hypothetical protein
MSCQSVLQGEVQTEDVCFTLTGVELREQLGAQSVGEEPVAA